MATTKSQPASIRSQAMKLVQNLSPEATWDDLMYEIYVRQKIEAGLADIETKKMHAHASIREEFSAQ
jgi:hypothetical protein